MKKILCATDGTEVSMKAELWASEMAKQLHAHLTYIYVSGVAPDDVTHTVGDMVAVECVEKRNADVQNHCERLITDSQLEDAKCVVLNRHPIAATVVEFAEREGYSHIITGTKGHVKGFSNIILGSVASEIIYKAHCAVTVVK